MSDIVDVTFEEEAEFDVDFSGTGKDGEVGGYYIPSGSGGVLNFTPSRTDMPEVPHVELPQGPQGKSAFDGAVEYGYTGTEEEFYSDFALFNERVQAAANAEKNAKASEEATSLSEKNAKKSEEATAVSEQNAAQYAEKAQEAIGRLTAFDVIPETGELMMYKSEGYTGPAFSINDNGELEVEIDV